MNQKNQAERNQPITYRGMLRRRKCFETSKEDRTQQEEKDWESFDE